MENARAQMKNSSAGTYNPKPREEWRYVGGNKGRRERMRYEKWKKARAQMKTAARERITPNRWESGCM